MKSNQIKSKRMMLRCHVEISLTRGWGRWRGGGGGWGDRFLRWPSTSMSTSASKLTGNLILADRRLCITLMLHRVPLQRHNSPSHLIQFDLIQFDATPFPSHQFIFYLCFILNIKSNWNWLKLNWLINWNR